MASGRDASYLISEQPWNYAFGRGSLLDRFVNLNGKILLLGCNHDNVTFLHYAEHIVDIADKRVARYVVPVDENGTRVWRPMEEFDTSGKGVHPNWPDAQAFLVDARGLLDLALPVMKAVAADPRAGR